MKTPAWARLLWAALLLVGCGEVPVAPSPDAGVEPPDSGTQSGPPPSAPTWAQDNPALANDNAPRLRAHAAPGLRVELFASARCEGTPLQSTLTDATGLATFAPHVEDNSTTLFSARVIDHEEKASKCSSPYVYTEDSLPPEVPAWSPAPPATSSLNAFTLGLKAEPSSQVELFATRDCTGGTLGVATASAAGQVSLGVTVEDDTTSHFSARATDAAGNVSACTPAHTYVEDSRAPGVPVLLASEPGSPGRTRSPVLTGTTEPGALVLLYADEPCTGPERGSAKADDAGSFRLVGSADPSTATRFRIRARDAAGNTSACSAGLTYVHDATEPALPRLSGFTPGSPANANAPVLAGDAEAGARLQVFANAACQSTPVAATSVGEDGRFLVTLSVADDTTTVFSTHAVDTAGNTSGCVSTTPFVEDSRAPVSPSSLKTSPSSPNSANTVAVSGNAEAGSTVLLFTTAECASSPLATGTANASGSFSLSVTVADDSTTSFHVAARDRAGNTSACAGPLVYVEDSRPPESASARVIDGPAEDLAVQLEGTTAEAHWEGFSDTRGPLTYEHLLARNSGCTSVVASVLSTGTQTAVRRTGLSLTDGTYYHCVRARSALGTQSGWVASNGFRVDVTAPRILESTPVDGQVYVSTHVSIRVVFTEPVETASVTPATFTLATGAGAPVSGKVACASTTECTFTPDAVLARETAFTVTLTTGVKDLAGRPFSAPATFSFATGGQMWSHPPVLVHPDAPGFQPEVGLDAGGNALAVWLQDSGGAWRPVASSRARGAGWSTPQMLNTLQAGDAAHLRLAVNEAGRGVATWELHTGSQVDLYAAEYVPGGGWGLPELLEHRSEPAGSPLVTVDDAGNALVLWRQSDGTAESVWAARLDPGVGWSAPLLLETGAGPLLSFPSLAADGTGRALAAWLQQEANGQVLVRGSRFIPGTGWTSSEPIAQDAVGITVATAMSRDGSALAVFRRSAATGFMPYASRFIPGLGWGTPEPLPGGSVQGEDLGVAMDRWGRALAVWTGPSASGNSALQMARFTQEGGWRAVLNYSQVGSQSTVTVDGQGHFHIAWTASAGSDILYALRLREGASTADDFYSYFLLDPYPLTAGSSKRPRLAANAAGEAVAVWSRDDGTGQSSHRIYSSIFD